MDLTRRELLVAAAAAPIVLRAHHGALGRRLGGTPIALVTADTEGHVVVVGLADGRVLRRVSTLERPRSIESARATTAVICHTSQGAVSLLDAPALAVRRVLRSFEAPRYTAIHPGDHMAGGRTLAYVTDSDAGELVTVDLARARVVHRLPLGGPARHVAVDPGGRVLWTALGSEAEEIAVVTSPTRRVRIAPSPCVRPSARTTSASRPTGAASG